MTGRGPETAAAGARRRGAGRRRGSRPAGPPGPGLGRPRRPAGGALGPGPGRLGRCCSLLVARPAAAATAAPARGDRRARRPARGARGRADPAGTCGCSRSLVVLATLGVVWFVVSSLGTDAGPSRRYQRPDRHRDRPGRGHARRWTPARPGRCSLAGRRGPARGRGRLAVAGRPAGLSTTDGRPGGRRAGRRRDAGRGRRRRGRRCCARPRTRATRSSRPTPRWLGSCPAGLVRRGRETRRARTPPASCSTGRWPPGLVSERRPGPRADRPVPRGSLQRAPDGRDARTDGSAEAAWRRCAAELVARRV